MVQYPFLESIMGKSKQKRKSTRESELPTNSIAARKRSKEYGVHRMVMTNLWCKTRGDVYRNVKKINDIIDVSPWLTEDSLMCEARRHKQGISNNQIVDK